MDQGKVNRPKDVKLLLEDRKERLKELACINQTTAILKEGKPVEESLHQIVLILPHAWQYPEYTVARILFEEKEYKSPGFRKTRGCRAKGSGQLTGMKGTVEVFIQGICRMDEGAFPKGRKAPDR
jgi:hypothetical protein